MLLLLIGVAGRCCAMSLSLVLVRWCCCLAAKGAVGCCGLSVGGDNVGRCLLFGVLLLLLAAVGCCWLLLAVVVVMCCCWLFLCVGCLSFVVSVVWYMSLLLLLFVVVRCLLLFVLSVVVCCCNYRLRALL